MEEPRQADVLLGSTSAGCRVRRWLTLGCASVANTWSRFFGGRRANLEALLHQEMETLKQRRAALKRQSKEAAKDQKLLAAKRQRLLKAR